jgi:hypothetical protein
LETPGADGVSPQHQSAESQGGLAQALALLWRHTQALELRAKQEKKFLLNFGELRRRALRVFDEWQANTFIDSAHPKLGGISPRMAVREDSGLRVSLALLPRKPRRPTH